MHKFVGLSILSFLSLWMVIVPSQDALAATPLPEADWYAVTWVESTDTLHWINADGEQASMARPTLEGEISQAQTRLHISPNGQYLVVISPLNNGREGIGFYDLQQGAFAFVHETQPNEVFMPIGPHPFTETSGHFVASLRMPSGAWRILVFEAATGNATHQLTWDSELLPPNIAENAAWWASPVQFNLDEALNTLEVRFQVIPSNEESLPPSFPAYVWRIPSGDTPESINSDTLIYSQQMGLDIHLITGELLYAWYNEAYGVPASPSDANSITLISGDNVQLLAEQPNGQVRLPRWLNNADWVGYYGHNGAMSAHWTVMTRDGMTPTPLSPAIIEVHHTSDGFLTKNTTTWTLNHVTSLEFEGFTEPGDLIFAPNEAFAIIYTTPANIPFTLTELGDSNNNSPVADDVQAPQAEGCEGALAPRLVVGEGARVAFTNGTDLNIRSAPAGDYLMQISEGTQVNVVDGPDCADGFLWWQIQFESQDVMVGGWAAEGDSDTYYLEPWQPLADGPGDIAPPPNDPDPIPDGPGDIAPPPNDPDPIPDGPGDIQAQPAVNNDCSLAPASQLTVGQTAHTAQNEGQLSMRNHPTDAIPFDLVPSQLDLSVIGGPLCHDGFRFWRVSLTLNGQAVIGWLVDGVGGQIYLLPGPAN